MRSQLQVLLLPAGYPVKVKAPRLSGGPGANYVLEFNYACSVMGAEMKIYFKAYYESTTLLVIQSLRKTDEVT